jgi:hypothetical protein
VIFVPEWPKGEFVSFCVGYILLDKITSMYCCCFHRDAVLFKVYTSVMIIKKTLYRIQISQFSSEFKSVKASSVWTTRTFRPDAHQYLEDSNKFKVASSGRNGKLSGRSSEFEKIPVFQCIRPDDVVISSGRHSVFDKH